MSVSLNVEQHLQHPITALFAMEILKGSSKHGIISIQNGYEHCECMNETELSQRVELKRP